MIKYEKLEEIVYDMEPILPGNDYFLDIRKYAYLGEDFKARPITHLFGPPFYNFNSRLHSSISQLLSNRLIYKYEL